jgi:hypothetical protein
MHEFSPQSTSPPPPQIHILNAVHRESALIGPAGAYVMSATYELRQDVGVHYAGTLAHHCRGGAIMMLSSAGTPAERRERQTTLITKPASTTYPQRGCARVGNQGGQQDLRSDGAMRADNKSERL